MLHQFSRTELLIGSEGLDRMRRSRVAVFGIGGVGGHAAEALVRSGLGAIDLIDGDTVCLTNLNRQIIAAHSTIGRCKVDVMKERLLDINPDVQVNARKLFYTPDSADALDLSVYSYIVDAVDTVSAKIDLCVRAQALHVPIISAMGAGNKLDPSRFEVADLYQTSVCPLAKVMRYELKRRGIEHLKVVYSKETPVKPLEDAELSCREGCVCPPGTVRKCANRRSIPGSTAFAPSIMGLLIASEVFRDLTGVTQI